MSRTSSCAGEIDVPKNVVAAGEEGMVRTAPEDGHRSLQAQNDARPVRDIQDAIGLDFKRPVIHHLPPVNFQRTRGPPRDDDRME